MIWTLPNILTIGRLAAAPGVALPFVLLPRAEAALWAFAIFTAAALTDWLDGWLARRLGSESALGRVLDPIADKAIVAVAVGVLMALHSGEAAPLDWQVAVPGSLILFREVLVAGLREALGPGARLAVTRLAKWKTTAQMSAIALMLSAEAVGIAGSDTVGGWDAGLGASLQGFGLIALWAAALLTIVTGWDYAAKAVRYIRLQEGR